MDYLIRFSFLFLTLCSFSFYAFSNQLDRVAVIVNDGVVLESDIQLKVREYKKNAALEGQSIPSDEVLRETVVEQLILDELQLQIADRVGIKISDEKFSIINSYVDKVIRKAGIWEVQVGSFSYFSRRIVLTMPIKQVSSLLEKSFLNKYTLPKSNYEEFFTATFLANRAYSKNIFDSSKSFSWICNNKLKGLFNEKNIYTVNFPSQISFDYKE